MSSREDPIKLGESAMENGSDADSVSIQDLLDEEPQSTVKVASREDEDWVFPDTEEEVEESTINKRRQFLLKQLQVLDLEEAKKEKERSEENASQVSSEMAVELIIESKWNEKGKLNLLPPIVNELPSDMNNDEQAAKSLPKPINDNAQKWDDIISGMSRFRNISLEQVIEDQREMKRVRPPMTSDERPNVTYSIAEQQPSIKPLSASEAREIINAIRNLPPPRIKFDKVSRVSSSEIMQENVRRNRILSGLPESQFSEILERELLSDDNSKAELAPSIRVEKAPVESFLSFDEVMVEMGFTERPEGKKPAYIAECRVLSEEALQQLVMERARMLVERHDANKVDVGTQTFVTMAGKPPVRGCVNCHSEKYHFTECQLKSCPGFYNICGADGYDTENCIYPHGVDHQQALGQCPGCSRSLTLYCPECPDCNVRYQDLVDYATWPTWMVPEDQQHLMDERKEDLKQPAKENFDEPQDKSNLVRAFLIRQNALERMPPNANPCLSTADELSKEKRSQAVKKLSTPLARKMPADVFRERSELNDGEDVIVLVPSIYKHSTTK